MKKFSIMKIILVVLASVFVIHQSVATFYKPISTESAVYYTSVDGFKITGIVIRNEILVKSSKNGVLHFMIDDGIRVAKNGTVANVYESESASITLSEIDSVKAKIEDIEDIMSFNNLQAANLDLINNRVFENLNRLVISTSAGNFDDVSDSAKQLLSSINRKQAATGENTDFSSQLSLLNSQLKELKVSLPNAKGKIKAEQSGYFLSKTDGYETVLTTDDLTKFTPEFLNNLKKKDVSKNVVGKIVSDYEWYIAAKVSLNESLKYKEGDSLHINTSVKSSPNLPVTVKKINISQSSPDAVVVFACSDMNSELASMRSGPMTVINKQYSGLKVSKKALRVVDSQKGVYVVSGMQAKFKPVEIVYSNDEFMICKKKENDGELRLYDQVIVKGKNLYDGKIVG